MAHALRAHRTVKRDVPESRGQQPSFGESGDVKNHITARGTVNTRPDVTSMVGSGTVLAVVV